MGNNGNAAVGVVKNFKAGQDLHSEWDSQMRKQTNSESSIKKSCPKYAFLGLCEDGLVKGIPKGSYIGSDVDNKEHAIALYNIFNENLTLPSKELHKLYVKKLGKSLTNNGQADVIVSLYQENLLILSGND